MIFLPIGCLMVILFILALPILFILGYFHIVTIGFEKLGIPGGATIFLLLAILVGSAINIPLTRKKTVYIERPRFFGLFRSKPRLGVEGLAINLGGAVIPILLSFYFLYLILQAGFKIEQILIPLILIIILSKLLSKVLPGRGIFLPALIPPIFSAIFALIFTPGFAAPVAFILGVLGVLIGADILNLRKGVLCTRIP